MNADFEWLPGDHAPPLVFLHGFLGQPSSWKETHRALKPAHRAISVRLPGHGLDPWKPRRDTFESAVDAVAASIPFVEKYWLVGYSMGARFALSLLGRHPDRVAGAVLIGCHPGLVNDRDRVERMTEDVAAADQILRDGIDSFVESWQARPLFASQALLSPLLRERHRQRRLNHTPQGLSWAMRTLGLGQMLPVGDHLFRFRIPIQLVTGERDQKFTELMREFVRNSPYISHAIVPGVGHDVNLEAPVALATIIQQFINAALQEKT